MMGDAGPAALDPEMDHEQAGGIAAHGQSARLAAAAPGFAQQIAIGVHQVGIGGDRIECAPPSALRFNLAHTIAERVNADHRIMQAHAAAQPPEMAQHGFGQTIGAAAHPPHAVALFQIVNQRVKPARAHRVAAEHDRLDGKCLAQLFGFHVSRDERMKRTPPSPPDQHGRGPDHRL